MFAQTTTIVPTAADSGGSTTGLVVFLVTMAIIAAGFAILYLRNRRPDR